MNDVMTMQLADCAALNPSDSASGFTFVLITWYHYPLHCDPEFHSFTFLSLSDLDKLIAFVNLPICSSDSFLAELLGEQQNRLG